MYTSDAVFVIHEETESCRVGMDNTLISDESVDEQPNEVNQTLINELNGLYPKHTRKVYFIIKNLFKNNLLSESHIEVRHKSGNEKMHLYDFFSIIFTPSIVKPRKLSKGERRFFKLLFISSELSPWPNYIFPKYLQKFNVRG
jgi:hypothetical protein